MMRVAGLGYTGRVRGVGLVFVWRGRCLLSIYV